MNKKNDYQKPCIKACHIVGRNILAASGVPVNTDRRDEDDESNPLAKRHDFLSSFDSYNDSVFSASHSFSVWDNNQSVWDN